MADFPTDVNSGTALACAEGEKKCMAARDDGRDGAAFICKNGSWDILQDCRSFERCVSNPTPHCTWASPRRRGKTSVAPRVETSEDVVKDSTVKLLESFCQSCAEKLENCSQVSTSLHMVQEVTNSIPGL